MFYVEPTFIETSIAVLMWNYVILVMNYFCDSLEFDIETYKLNVEIYVINGAKYNWAMYLNCYDT